MRYILSTLVFLMSFNSSGALLPQSGEDNAILYTWLDSFEESDFDVPREAITFTQGVSTAAELYPLFYALANDPPDSDLIRYPSNAFLLDDGGGHGIEGDGQNVRILSAARDITIGPQYAGTFYLKLTGTGVANPYYQNTALANRLSTQSVAMMMRVNDALYNDGGATMPEYIGMEVMQCMSAFEASKPFATGITPEIREAFYRTVDSIIDWWDLNGGPRDVNTNMDTKGFYGLTLLYNGAKAEGLVDISENAKSVAQKWLIGNTSDPGLAQGYLNHVIFHSAGYIGELNMPETSYNGISFYYLTQAASAVLGEAGWEWLWDADGIVDRMARFKAYQTFRDPDGHYNGPSGYAVRTGFPYTEDQAAPMGRDLLAAQISDYAIPFSDTRYNRAWNTTSLAPQSVAAMDDRVRHYIQYGYSSARFELAAPVYLTMGSGSGDSRWWPLPSGLSVIDYYDQTFLTGLSALISGESPLLVVPVSRFGAQYSEAFGRDGGQPEFWAFKRSYNGKELSAFVESFGIDSSDYGYDSWRGGGSIQSVWSDTAGLVINSRNSLHSDNAVKWPAVETWATHHLWGTLGDGTRFSSAQRDSRNASHAYDNATTPTEVVSTSTPDRESGSFSAGSATYTRTISDSALGIEVRTELASDGSVQFSTLWESLPVFVSKNKTTNAETSIEYWNGSAWALMPADGDTVTAYEIRLGRLHAASAGYVYITLSSPKPIKLAPEWQANYQAADYYRQLMIDLHPNSGTAQAVASTSVTYVISSSSYINDILFVVGPPVVAESIATISATSSAETECRHASKAQSQWAEMTVMSTADGLEHTASLPVSAGLVGRACVRCLDVGAEVSDVECVDYIVPAQPKRPILFSQVAR
jgi:hypothetical protein